jgi:Rod binding domain-containing protein
MNVSDVSMLRFDDAKLRGPDGFLRKGKTAVSEREKLKDACNDFEAIFIKQMLNAMRKTVHKTGLMEGGMAEDIFEDMLHDEYSQVMAKSGGFGVADMLFRQFKDSVPEK